MKIIILDDEVEELKKIHETVNKYAKNHLDLNIKIFLFSSPYKMLEDIEENGYPDIALLDICMPGMLGTEIARTLQKKGEDITNFIFLTNSSDFAVEAFAMHANDYIKKPFADEQIFNALDRVIQKNKNKVFMPIQCGKETYRIDLFSILYVESKSNMVEIHLSDGRILNVRTSLKNFFENFQNFDEFFLLGASYIVNLRLISILHSTFIEMDDGSEILIPRRVRNSFKDHYLDFYKKEALKYGK